MPRYKIIANPTAGHGAGKLLIPKIKEALNQYQLNYEMVETLQPWHAAELAQQAVADGFDGVVAAGGDGTCNEVINGLFIAKNSGIGEANFGVITIGRGNDFAFSMGLPVLWSEGCRKLAEGAPRKIDIGKVYGGLYPKGRYFGNGVGIGFDAVVGFVAAKSKLRGFLSYMVAAMKTIFLYYRAPLLKITYGSEVMTRPFLMVSVMNGRRMGGGFMMAPNSRADDGLFDLCLAGAVSRPGIFGLIPRFMQGTQATHPAITTGRTDRLVVQAVQGSLPAHADGETLCTAGEELTLEVIPGQLSLIA